MDTGFRCIDCGFECPDWDGMRSHTLAEHGRGPYCDRYGEMFLAWWTPAIADTCAAPPYINLMPDATWGAYDLLP